MRENKEAYEQYCDEILPCIVGRALWDKEVCLKEIIKIASATDEAWGLLLLENSWDLWKWMAECGEGDKLPKNDRPSTKWTSCAGSAGKYEGWGDEGVPRYNELVKAAKEDRSKNTLFDAVFLREKKDAKEASGKSNRKRARGDEEIILVENDIDFLVTMEQV